MKVLQINKYYYKKGGAETSFFNTIALLEKEGHTVIPFSLRNNKNEPSLYDSYFVDYPELSDSSFFTKLKSIPSFVYNKKAAKLLDRLLTKEKPDIAHIHLMFNSLSISILPVLRKHNIPIVMTLHDYRLVCPAYLFTDRKGKICERCIPNQSYWHCITGRCSKGSLANSALLALDSYCRKYLISPQSYINHFIFVSNFSQNKHEQAIEGFKDKSSVIYNFTPFSIDKEPVLKKEDYILFFGRLSHEKGISTLIKAIDGSDVKLKIIGTGPLSQELSQTNNQNIHLLGYKTGKELEDYIRNARFIVVPSECYENNPMTIVESFMLGTPVIASNIGGIPELFQGDKKGFLFETRSISNLRDTILKAIKTPENEYNEMCQNAIQFALNNFSCDTHYNKLISIYETTIKNHQP